MEELIELVLGNPLILLLIVGGLISLFRNKDSAKKTEEAKRTQQPAEQDQPKKPSMFGDFLERMEDALTDGEEEKQSQPTAKPKPQPSIRNQEAEQTISAHEKRMEQMQQLSNQMGAGTYEGAGEESHSGIIDGVAPQVTIDVNMGDQTRTLRKQMKKRLNKKQLIDSVIMSEVLGEPRSKKPYQGRNMSRNKLY